MPSGPQPPADNDDSDASSIRSSTSAQGTNDGGNSDHDADAVIENDNPPPSPRRLPKHWRKVLLAATIIIALFTVTAWQLYPFRPPPRDLPTPTHPARPPGPNIKIMIVGDSITHGYEGDYTWRYRLWAWLRESGGVNATFVGPYGGTFPPPDSPAPPSPQPTTPGGLETRVWGGYARDVDAAFLRGDGTAHFAHWGRQAAQMRDLVGGAVRAYGPDYVLVALGFNDLAWGAGGPRATAESVRRLVTGARGARRGVRFALADVPHRVAFAGGEDLPARTDRYNELLEGLVGELTSEESPVRLVRLREAYACDLQACPASHDGLHPNALGEFQIARAFSRVLHDEYGLGSANFTIPDEMPLRPCWAPENVRAVAAATVRRPIKVTWDPMYGAFGYHVQARQKGWRWVWRLFTDIREYEMDWPGPGQEWEVRVRSYCGDQQDPSPWSDVASVRT